MCVFFFRGDVAVSNLGSCERGAEVEPGCCIIWEISYEYWIYSNALEAMIVNAKKKMDRWPCIYSMGREGNVREKIG